jgi:hypothetical protein
LCFDAAKISAAAQLGQAGIWGDWKRKRFDVKAREKPKAKRHANAAGVTSPFPINRPVRSALSSDPVSPVGLNTDEDFPASRDLAPKQRPRE